MKLPILKWTHTHTYERNFIPSSKHTHTPIKSPQTNRTEQNRTIKKKWVKNIYSEWILWKNRIKKKTHNRTKFAVNSETKFCKQRSFFRCKLIFVLQNFGYFPRFVVANVSACVCAFWWIINCFFVFVCASDRLALISFLSSCVVYWQQETIKTKNKWCDFGFVVVVSKFSAAAATTPHKKGTPNVYAERASGTDVQQLIMPNNCLLILLLVCCASVRFSCAETIDSNHSDCPEKCVCRKVNDNGSLLKVKCGGLPQVKLTSIKELNFDNIKYDVVQLYVFLRVCCALWPILNANFVVFSFHCAQGSQ